MEHGESGSWSVSARFVHPVTRCYVLPGGIWHPVGLNAKSRWRFSGTEGVWRTRCIKTGDSTAGEFRCRGRLDLAKMR